ncbi:hypothetical protein L1887_07727 [Cichorium endivia]|nr:hypothetical protein L1887_07727 [Cichorium endivia]
MSKSIPSKIASPNSREFDRPPRNLFRRNTLTYWFWHVRIPEDKLEQLEAGSHDQPVHSTPTKVLPFKLRERIATMILVWQYEERSGYESSKGLSWGASAARRSILCVWVAIRRRIMAFVGGFDLCGGRYDTPGHPIFSTLQTLHKDDYHQPNYTGPTTGCPREPWHDLHNRIEGPAAYDLLKNFEERRLRASKPQGIRSKMKKSVDDSLLQLDRIPDIL